MWEDMLGQIFDSKSKWEIPNTHEHGIIEKSEDTRVRPQCGQPSVNLGAY